MQPSVYERLSPPFHGAPIILNSGNRGYASWRSLTPAYVLSPAERAQSTVRLRLTRDKCFLTAFGRVKSGLKPAVKNRATHGGEDCTARRVKTKADALGIGGQTPICRGIDRP